MSKQMRFIDILCAGVDFIDTFRGYVDFLQYFRQVRSIGRLHRQMRDPGTEIVVWVGFSRLGKLGAQRGISFVAVSLHPRYSFAIESAAGSDNH